MGRRDSPIPNPEASPSDSHLQMKELDKQLLRAGRWPTQNELNGIFGGSLSHICQGIFLTL